MDNKLPKRKHPRLDAYDYSAAGAYFVTICTHNRKCVLSRIVESMAAPTAEKTVGRGLAPAETFHVECTEIGRIAELQLLQLEKRYPFLKVSQYVVMPNHIHVIFVIKDGAAGASPRPTIMDVVCAYKSLTVRACRQCGFAEKLFQTSFYEHVIRNQQDYTEIAEYICENPMRWQSDELFA